MSYGGGASCERGTPVVPEGLLEVGVGARSCGCGCGLLSVFGFRAPGFDSGSWDLGIRVWAARFQNSDFGFRISGFGFGVPGFGIRVSEFGFRVLGFGSGF